MENKTNEDLATQFYESLGFFISDKSSTLLFFTHIDLDIEYRYAKGQVLHDSDKKDIRERVSNSCQAKIATLKKYKLEADKEIISEIISDTLKAKSGHFARLVLDYITELEQD